MTTLERPAPGCLSHGRINAHPILGLTTHAVGMYLRISPNAVTHPLNSACAIWAHPPSFRDRGQLWWRLPTRPSDLQNPPRSMFSPSLFFSSSPLVSTHSRIGLLDEIAFAAELIYLLSKAEARLVFSPSPFFRHCHCLRGVG